MTMAGVRRYVRPPLVLGIALLLVILLVSRTCAQARVSVSQEDAVATARGQVDFTPDGHNIRFVRRGVTQHPYWAVSLWTRQPDGTGLDRVTVVVVDARSGDVTEVDRAQ
jgi:hypothetical protein